jgi:hypothetical protein
VIENLLSSPAKRARALKMLGKPRSPKVVKVNPQVKLALRAAFEEVLDEYRSVNLKSMPMFGRLSAQVHSFTGEEMGVWTERLRTSMPLTEAFILDHMRKHLEKHGSLPNRGSGPVDGLPGETWSAWDAALHKGLRGLSGGSSLARLAEQHLGKRNHMNLPALTEEFILGHMRKHLEKHGELPNQHSGPVNELPGEIWINWDSALRKGLRGLSGGSSLARLAQDNFGKRNRNNLPDLTEAFILGLWSVGGFPPFTLRFLGWIGSRAG